MPSSQRVLPNICSRKWVYEQYDSMVGIANTTVNTPSDAAVIRLNGSNKHLAVTVDCNARYVWADPFVGGQIAVSEAPLLFIFYDEDYRLIQPYVNGYPLDPMHRVNMRYVWLNK